MENKEVKSSEILRLIGGERRQERHLLMEGLEVAVNNDLKPTHMHA